MKWLKPSRQFLCVMLVALLLTTLAIETTTATKAATPISISTPYMTITVNVRGSYTIVSQSPSWSFAGNVGKPLTNVVVNTGSDNHGSYQEIDFSYVDKNSANRGGGLRAYNSNPAVLFTDSYISSTSNTLPFPRLSIPAGLFRMSYQFAFAAHSFTQSQPDSPLLYFDGQAHGFVLSAASHFMIANTVPRGSVITSGINPSILTLPAGFAQQTLLVVGTGINNVMQSWGHTMTDLQGKTRPANDDGVTLNTLGYWTDHGATYYYNFDPTLGYAGTLQGVYNSFKQAGIPLGYMQLDDWWYPKGPNHIWSARKNGIYTYNADPTLFPNGLLAFQQQLGIPLLTHAKYVDASSPYHTQYSMSNNVVTDPNYWNMVANYLQNNGVATYEQDWLSNQALPAMNLTDPDAFMNNMASAMSAAGLTMQYSMPMPRHFLQSSMYNNLTSIRVSGDRFSNARWDSFLYASELASALGVWPWSDVFMSGETDNLLLSTLSAGVVGVGDAIGAESATNLFQTIRADGVIVKPDAPIVPVDSLYISDAQSLNQPMVASTYSDFGGGMRALYVFAYARGANTPASASFTPASLGLPGSVYVYNYFTGTGTVVPAGGTFTDSVSSGSYYIVTPIGASGIAFLGDAGKFVSLGKKRITTLTDTGSVQATITFAAGETSLTMYGYAPTQPNVTASDGATGPVTYNSVTGLFSYPVTPGGDNAATVSMSLT
ncbi:MAG: hypothetical protein ACRDIV_23260 [Ktedonobacteraceae bacterium]